jgi:hypothetical protein
MRARSEVLANLRDMADDWSLPGYERRVSAEAADLLDATTPRPMPPEPEVGP